MVQNELLRVTQIDAVYLDREIYNIFVANLQECVKFLPLGLTAPFQPELNLLVTLGILSSSMLYGSSTFGQKLLSIKYEDVTPSKRALYILFNCLGYVKDRSELWKPSHGLSRVAFNIDALVKVCSFINLSIFLNTGKKPVLLERILGLNQVNATSNAQRQFGSKYMARELLWNGFIEVLVYLLPLINYHKLKRTMHNLNVFHNKPATVMVENRLFTSSTKCPHCYEVPILPHHMGCSHIFCYSCLKGNEEADLKYQCPICEFSSSPNICERFSV